MGTALEEWHSRLSSGFHTHTHTCTFTYTHIRTSHMCALPDTQTGTHTHTYAYTQDNNAPNRTFSKYKYVLHILISLSYHMRQNFLSNKFDMVSEKKLKSLWKFTGSSDIIRGSNSTCRFEVTYISINDNSKDILTSDGL